MFSKRLIWVAPRVVSLTRFVAAVPLKMEENTLKLSFDSKSIPRIRFNFYLVVLWLVLSLHIIQTRIRANEKTEVYISLAFVFAFILMELVISISCFHAKNVCRALSGMFSLVTKIHHDFFKPNFNPNTYKYNIVVEVLLAIIVINYFGLLLLASLVVVFDPRATVFLGKLIPKIYFYVPVKLLIILIHVYIFTIGNFSCGFMVCAGTIYGFYVSLILSKELRIRKNCTNYLTNDSFRKSSNLRIAYRSIQLVHQNLMCFFGLYIVVLNKTLIVSIVFMIFVLLKYWSFHDVLTKVSGTGYTLMFVIIWTLILELGKILFLKGNKVLNSWKCGGWGSNRENRIMKRFRLSCKPILLSYGKLFVIGRRSTLVFYRCITRGTVRALLTL